MWEVYAGCFPAFWNFTTCVDGFCWCSLVWSRTYMRFWRHFLKSIWCWTYSPAPYVFSHEMQYEIWHFQSASFLCLSSAKWILWVTLSSVWIPDTEVHIPVVSKWGFPNVPDSNDFSQKAWWINTRSCSWLLGFHLTRQLVDCCLGQFCICCYNSTFHYRFAPLQACSWTG